MAPFESVIEAWVDTYSAFARAVGAHPTRNAWSSQAEQAEEAPPTGDEWTGAVRSIGFTSTANSTATKSGPAKPPQVTVKSVSPLDHEVYCHPRDTGVLIGKGGRNLKQLQALCPQQRKHGKAIEVDRRHGGLFRVRGSAVTVSAVAAEMNQLLAKHYDEDHAHTGKTTRRLPALAVKPDDKPKAKVAPTTAKAKGKANPWALLDSGSEASEDETGEEEDEEHKARREQEEEERGYQLDSLGNFAWVQTRLALTKTLEQSLAARPLTRDQRVAVDPAALNQDLLVHLLSFVGDARQAASAAAAVFSVNRRAALRGLTHSHRVWKVLGMWAFPDRRLRCTQPHLYNFAVALHQQHLDPLDEGATGTAGSTMRLEFTTNPRTKRLDAAVVHWSTNGNVVDLSTSNDSVVMGAYSTAAHWRRRRRQTEATLTQLGRWGHEDGKRRGGRPSARPPTNGARVLAALRPIAVAVKTAVVRACDGADFDLDAFLQLWRLALALTDPREASGATRRAAVDAQLRAFSEGQLDPDDFGNLVATLLCVHPSQWRPVLLRLLHMSTAKNSKWMARALALAGHADWIDVLRSATDAPALTDADLDVLLQTCFDASVVSRRIVLFFRGLQRVVLDTGFFAPKAESLHGFRATPALRKAVAGQLQALLAVKSWDGFFGALGGEDGNLAAAAEDTDQTRAEVVELLQRAWRDGLARGYFADDTDFSKIHAHGTSSIFLVGQSYDKAAFAIDRSGSMGALCGDGGPVRGGSRRAPPTRYQAVCQHLLTLLEARSVDFSFALVLFDNTVVKWRNGELVQNTSDHRRELRKFLETHGPYGGTDIHAGVSAILSCKGARERFLLTDGEGYEQGRILSRVREGQEADGAPLHCIGVALSDYGRGRQLLEAIAKAGHGEVCFVDSDELVQQEEEEDEEGERDCEWGGGVDRAEAA